MALKNSTLSGRGRFSPAGRAVGQRTAGRSLCLHALPATWSALKGSLVFAAAGILRDKPATTYWEQLGLLEKLDPTI
jgi:hypothetical protein